LRATHPQEYRRVTKGAKLELAGNDLRVAVDLSPFDQHVEELFVGALFGGLELFELRWAMPRRSPSSCAGTVSSVRTKRRAGGFRARR
jgi:hypothetical protein